MTKTTDPTQTEATYDLFGTEFTTDQAEDLEVALSLAIARDLDSVTHEGITFSTEYAQVIVDKIRDQGIDEMTCWTWCVDGQQHEVIRLGHAWWVEMGDGRLAQVQLDSNTITLRLGSESASGKYGTLEVERAPSRDGLIADLAHGLGAEAPTNGTPERSYAWVPVEAILEGDLDKMPVGEEYVIDLGASSTLFAKGPTEAAQLVMSEEFAAGGGWVLGYGVVSQLARVAAYWPTNERTRAPRASIAGICYLHTAGIMEWSTTSVMDKCGIGAEDVSSFVSAARLAYQARERAKSGGESPPEEA